VQLKVAQFYRYFCRYTVVLARATDKDLITEVEACKMILGFTLEEAPGFIQSRLGKV
jgi:hypothetical protein